MCSGVGTDQRTPTSHAGRTKLDLVGAPDLVLEIDQSRGYAGPDSDSQEVPMNTQIAIFFAADRAAELVREADRDRLVNAARGAARATPVLRQPNRVARLTSWLSLRRVALATR
jgi:hypothetical protein